jgi:hypothetical protein
VAERDQLARILTGVSTPAEEVLGSASLGGEVMSLSNSATAIDEMTREYIDEQEGEEVAHGSRFPIGTG